MRVQFRGDYACECADMLWEPGEVKDLADCPDSPLFVAVDTGDVIEPPAAIEQPAPDEDNEERVGYDG